MTTEEKPKPPNFAMTFVTQSPVLGAGVRKVGEIGLPFIPRAGDVFSLPSGTVGMVQQVRFDITPEGSFGILVILGQQQGGRG